MITYWYILHVDEGPISTGRIAWRSRDARDAWDETHFTSLNVARTVRRNFVRLLVASERAKFKIVRVTRKAKP